MNAILPVREVCPTSTQNRIQNGALLVDVREPAEVAALSFDVPSILHIPLSQFEERYPEIPQNREAILVCAHGQRSHRAAGFLQNRGYRQVYNMSHGMERWVQKGFPVKGEISAAQGDSSCCSDSSCC